MPPPRTRNPYSAEQQQLQAAVLAKQQEEEKQKAEASRQQQQKQSGAASGGTQRNVTKKKKKKPNDISESEKGSRKGSFSQQDASLTRANSKLPCNGNVDYFCYKVSEEESPQSPFGLHVFNPTTGNDPLLLGSYYVGKSTRADTSSATRRLFQRDIATFVKDGDPSNPNLNVYEAYSREATLNRDSTSGSQADYEREMLQAGLEFAKRQGFILGEENSNHYARAETAKPTVFLRRSLLDGLFGLRKHLASGEGGLRVAAYMHYDEETGAKHIFLFDESDHDAQQSDLPELALKPMYGGTKFAELLTKEAAGVHGKEVVRVTGPGEENDSSAKMQEHYVQEIPLHHFFPFLDDSLRVLANGKVDAWDCKGSKRVKFKCTALKGFVGEKKGKGKKGGKNNNVTNSNVSEFDPAAAASRKPFLPGNKVFQFYCNLVAGGGDVLCVGMRDGKGALKHCYVAESLQQFERDYVRNLNEVRDEMKRCGRFLTKFLNWVRESCEKNACKVLLFEDVTREDGGNDANGGETGDGDEHAKASTGVNAAGHSYRLHPSVQKTGFIVNGKRPDTHDELRCRVTVCNGGKLVEACKRILRNAGVLEGASREETKADDNHTAATRTTADEQKQVDPAAVSDTDSSESDSDEESEEESSEKEDAGWTNIASKRRRNAAGSHNAGMPTGQPPCFPNSFSAQQQQQVPSNASGGWTQASNTNAGGNGFNAAGATSQPPAGPNWNFTPAGRGNSGKKDKNQDDGGDDGENGGKKNGGVGGGNKSERNAGKGSADGVRKRLTGVVKVAMDDRKFGFILVQTSTVNKDQDGDNNADAGDGTPCQNPSASTGTTELYFRFESVTGTAGLPVAQGDRVCFLLKNISKKGAEKAKKGEGKKGAKAGQAVSISVLEFAGCANPATGSQKNSDFHNNFGNHRYVTQKRERTGKLRNVLQELHDDILMTSKATARGGDDGGVGSGGLGLGSEMGTGDESETDPTAAAATASATEKSEEETRVRRQAALHKLATATPAFWRFAVDVTLSQLERSNQNHSTFAQQANNHFLFQNLLTLIVFLGIEMGAHVARFGIVALLEGLVQKQRSVGSKRDAVVFLKDLCRLGLGIGTSAGGSGRQNQNATQKLQSFESFVIASVKMFPQLVRHSVVPLLETMVGLVGKFNHSNESGNSSSSSRINRSTTPNPALQSFLTTLLLKALTGLAAPLTIQNGSEDLLDVDWALLPSEPTVQELQCEEGWKSSVLPKVLRSAPYEDFDHYMDTYFRLQREDCFAALRKGVSAFVKSRELDFRDMRVYRPKLIGLHIGEDTVSLAISMLPQGLEHCRRNILSNWHKTTDALMTGNLLCFSGNGKFDDNVFGTVSVRDGELLEKGGVILVEICTDTASARKLTEREDGIMGLNASGIGNLNDNMSSNDANSDFFAAGPDGADPFEDGDDENDGDGPDSSNPINADQRKQAAAMRKHNSSETNNVLTNMILHMLGSGRTALVAESPTYFRAYAPVLKCLQTQFQSEADLPFAKQLIHGQFEKKDHVDDTSKIAEEEKKSLNEKFYLLKQRQDGSRVFIRRDHVFHKETPSSSVKSVKQHKYISVRAFVRLVEEDPRKCASLSLFSEEQIQAVAYALQNPLAIIQGCPGSGKSFLGIWLVRILLTAVLSPCEECEVCAGSYELQSDRIDLSAVSFDDLPKEVSGEDAETHRHRVFFHCLEKGLGSRTWDSREWKHARRIALKTKLNDGSKRSSSKFVGKKGENVDLSFIAGIKVGQSEEAYTQQVHSVLRNRLWGGLDNPALHPTEKVPMLSLIELLVKKFPTLRIRGKTGRPTDYADFPKKELGELSTAFRQRLSEHLLERKAQRKRTPPVAPDEAFPSSSVDSSSTALRYVKRVTMLLEAARSKGSQDDPAQINFGDFPRPESQTDASGYESSAYYVILGNYVIKRHTEGVVTPKRDPGESFTGYLYARRVATMIKERDEAEGVGAFFSSDASPEKPQCSCALGFSPNPDTCRSLGLKCCILTHKNHALDEACADLFKHYPNSIVRIGGRGGADHPELEDRNLRKLKWNFDYKDSHWEERKAIRDDYDSAKDSLEQAAFKFQTSRAFSLRTFLFYINGVDQLKTLLLQNENIWQIPRQNKRGQWYYTSELPRVQKMITNLQRYIFNEFTRNNSVFTFTEFFKQDWDDTDWRAWLRHELETAVSHALGMWVPHADQFRDLANSISKSGGRCFDGSGISSSMDDVLRNVRNQQQQGAAENDASDEKAEDDDEVEVDEEGIQEQLQERLVGAMDNVQQGNKLLESIIRLDVEGFVNPAGNSHSGIGNANTNSSLIFIPEIVDSIPEDARGGLLGMVDLWKLDPGMRCVFVQLLLQMQCDCGTKEFATHLRTFEAVAAKRRKFNDKQSVEVISNNKISAMTVTGASIHQQLMSQVKYDFLLVEEAAEIAEAPLVACFRKSVKHCIMTGDHLQLPPSVQSHNLKVNHHLGLSMFERLINNDCPYKKLMTQSRMLPELSVYLKRRYPNIQDNPIIATKLVGKRPTCLEKNVYWWDTESLEESFRSYSNQEEAERTVKLAIFLIVQGWEPKRITILAPYNGQVSKLRKLLKPEMEKLPRTIVTPEEVTGVRISAADRFQGDENDIILISLTRCNPAHKAGFLKTDEGINRLVVMQSRARCCMIIVGSVRTFENDKTRKGALVPNQVWKPYIDELRADGNIGKKITLQCPRHAEVFKVEILNHKGIPSASAPTCGRKCGKIMMSHDAFGDGKTGATAGNTNTTTTPDGDPLHCPSVDDATQSEWMRSGAAQRRWMQLRQYGQRDPKLGKCGHPCQEPCHAGPCFPNKCQAIVEFPCKTNPEHPKLQRRCTVPEAKVLCKHKVTFNCSNCRQPLERECHMKEESVERRCKTKIKFACNRGCGSELQRFCHQKEEDILCQSTVEFMCKDNKHKLTRKCWEEQSEIKCQNQVEFSCSVDPNHKLTRRCHQKESDIQCFHEVEFICQGYLDAICGSSNSTDAALSWRHPPHKLKRRCYQRESDIKCQYPCARKLVNCGHYCSKSCWEPCTTNFYDCRFCIEDANERRRKEEQLLKEANMQKQREMREKLEQMKRQIERSSIFCRALNPERDFGEYKRFQTQVEKICMVEGFTCVIKRIEKISITGSRMELKHLEAIQEMVDGVKRSADADQHLNSTEGLFMFNSQRVLEAVLKEEQGEKDAADAGAGGGNDSSSEKGKGKGKNSPADADASNNCGFKVQKDGLGIKFCVDPKKKFAIFCQIHTGKIRYSHNRNDRSCGLQRLKKGNFGAVMVQPKADGSNTGKKKKNQKESDILERDELYVFDGRLIKPLCFVEFESMGENASSGDSFGAVPSYWKLAQENAIHKMAGSHQWRVVPLDVKSDEAVVLQQVLRPEGSLGGKDQKLHGYTNGGKYDGFKLACAWRIENISLWQKYEAECSRIAKNDFAILKKKFGDKMPKLKVRDGLYRAYSKLPAKLRGDINEVYLTHGTGPDTVVKILNSGMNERFSRPGLFGSGTYFAEDVAKNDQYVQPDQRFNSNPQLHALLFKNNAVAKHPGSDIFYIFVCRVCMGYYQTVKEEQSKRRECDPVAGTDPPVLHHGLLAETGVQIQRYREFITYHSDRIFPEYLVAYQRK